MDYADAIRRQAEDAPRAALPAVAALMWKAFGDGHITEAEAEALSVLIETRTTGTVSSRRSWLGQASNSTGTTTVVINEILSDRQGSPRTGMGSRPRTDASLERRRRWAASGRIPPALAAKFTPGEQAALSLVAAETAKRGDCRLAIEHMAALAGVSRSTVKAAIREARKLGIITVEERRITEFRNDTNVVRITSPEWVAWLRLARKGVTVRDPLGRKGGPSRCPLGAKGVADRDPLNRSKGMVNRHLLQGGGVKFSTGTPTQVSKSGEMGAGAQNSERPARRGSPA